MSTQRFDSIEHYFEDSSLYVGANNVELLVDVKIDLTDATEVAIRVITPEDPAEIITWEGEIYEEHYIKYMIQSTDISVAGIYKVFAYAKWIDGKELAGQTALLYIKELGT